MTYHVHSEKHLVESAVTNFKFADTDGQNPVRASQAETQDDFMQVAHLMKRAARQGGSPLDPNYIGRVLAWLNHGGSGPDTGFVVLAKNGDIPEGFALMLPKPETGLELVWLYPEIGHRGDGMAEVLLREVERIAMKQPGRTPTPTIQ